MSRDLFVSLNTLSALFLHCPHCLSTLLSIPVPLPVSLSPTQFDAMLIRLLLISRIVLLPQTFEMYTPFNLFCLSGVVAWTPEKKNWIVFPPLHWVAMSVSLACQCLCVSVRASVCIIVCLSICVLFSGRSI